MPSSSDLNASTNIEEANSVGRSTSMNQSPQLATERKNTNSHTSIDVESLKALIPTKPPPPQPPKKNLRRRRNNHERSSNKCLECIKVSALPIFVCFLSGAAWAAGGLFLIPHAYPIDLYPVLFVLNQIIALSELTLTLMSYFKCVRTDPGYVEKDWENQCTGQEDRDFVMKLELTGRGEERYCHKCNVYQPPRSHHSSANNKLLPLYSFKCVLRMDHYCIWVNNCVGLRNHKFFFLFLFYMVVGFVHFGVTAGVAIAQSVRNMEGISPVSLVVMIMSTVFVFPIACMVGMFFGWNVYLICTNQTSIESHINGSIKSKLSKTNHQTFKHVFNVTLKQNIQAVLGINTWLWLIPVPGNVGDGIHYPTIPQSLIASQQSQVTQAKQQIYDYSSGEESDQDEFV
ncbi:S-acyltransferase [Acrasis kona]|uniref:Palmitoyltransferase n=1 Tax=Acrasis kona TaxID=1008807 RepID=A0AAW2ZJD7_9EUKA